MIPKLRAGLEFLMRKTDSVETEFFRFMEECTCACDLLGK